MTSFADDASYNGQFFNHTLCLLLPRKLNVNCYSKIFDKFLHSNCSIGNKLFRVYWFLSDLKKWYDFSKVDFWYMTYNPIFNYLHFCFTLLFQLSTNFVTT